MTIAQGDPDHGHHRVPPIPTGIVMTDRGTGVLWLLTWDFAAHTYSPLSFTAKMRFAATTVVPIEIALHAYGHMEGPYLHDPGTGKLLRLLFRDGRIGYEVVSDLGAARIVSQSRVFGRIRLNRTVLEVILPDTWVRTGDVLAWEENDL